MIMTVGEFRQHVATDAPDDVLEARLQAVESFIRNYTNNSFQKKGTGRIADVVGGMFSVEAQNLYEVGDTLHVSGSDKNDGLYTVKEAGEHTFKVNEPTRDEIDIFVTKVEYPADVKVGAVELMKHDICRREKVGIASERISRHEVSYHAVDATNTVQGYPQHLMGFLQQYMKARFGQGVRA
jgi:hypothetical protein